MRVCWPHQGQSDGQVVAYCSHNPMNERLVRTLNNEHIGAMQYM